VPTLRLPCLTFCFTKFSSGGNSHTDTVAGSPRTLWVVIFQGTWIAQSSRLPVCKKLQLFEPSANEVEMLCFGKYPQVFRWGCQSLCKSLQVIASLCGHVSWEAPKSDCSLFSVDPSDSIRLHQEALSQDGALPEFSKGWGVRRCLVCCCYCLGVPVLFLWQIKN
jgi:hypothetical protein